MGRAPLDEDSVLGPPERAEIGERTSAALQAAKARGVRLGGPVELDDDVRQRIHRRRGEGATYREIVAELDADDVPTARGGRWHPDTVRKVVRSVDLDRQAAAARARYFRETGRLEPRR
jgi:DNA invertase Pin-like site-specific DNA recombinase